MANKGNRLKSALSQMKGGDRMSAYTETDGYPNRRAKITVKKRPTHSRKGTSAGLTGTGMLSRAAGALRSRKRKQDKIY
jgi:hypothetical protein